MSGLDPLDIIWEWEEQRLLTAPSAPTQKGVCPYCQRHIGRGIHRHVKACKERKN